MKHHYLSLLLITGFVQFAQGQPTPGLAPPYQNQLSLTIGLHQGYFKDKNFSPLQYNSKGFNVGLGFERYTKAGNLFSANLGVSLNQIHSTASDRFESDRFILDFALGFKKGIETNQEERKIYLGANYRSYIDISLYGDTDAITFLGFHGFELAANGHWKTGTRSQIKSSIAIPAFGLLVRPPYTGWDKFINENPTAIIKILTRGNWTSINQFRSLRAQVGWVYQIAPHWAIETSYSLNYFATNKLDPLRIFNNHYSLTLSRNY